MINRITHRLHQRLAIGDEDISLSADVMAGTVIRADSEQLHRVLSNLVRNARQAIASAGTGGEICIHSEEDDECWRIHVRDTGPGLPAKAREQRRQPLRGRSRTTNPGGPRGHNPCGPLRRQPQGEPGPRARPINAD